jgi:hypothetical protein
MHLTPNTVYHFHISSADSAKNTTTTKDYVVSIKPDTTSPTITAFSILASSTSMTVPITTFTATDNVDVTGYMVTRTTSIPSSDSTEWTSAPPISYVFSQSGAVSLYAWAKDASGNVSIGRIASSIISTGSSYPKITIVTSMASPSTATITWITDQPTKSVIQYGSVVQYGSQIAHDNFIATHSVTLTGLTSGTRYYYYITATNAAGVEQNTGRQTIDIP